MSLRRAIDSGAILAGQKDGREEDQTGAAKQESLLARRLHNRLHAFYVSIGSTSWTGNEENVQDMAVLQQATGEAALVAIELINKSAIEKRQDGASSSNIDETPTFGSRDLQTIRTLSSIASTWSLGSCISAYDDTLYTVLQQQRNKTPKLQDVNEEELSAARLQQENDSFLAIRSSLHSLLTRFEVLSFQSSTVADAVTGACSVYMTGACIRIGWGPVHPLQKQAQDQASKHATTMTADLLKRMPTTTCLKLLSAMNKVGSVNSSKKGKGECAKFVKSTTQMLFSAQLLRKDGVMALLRNTFTIDDDHDRGLMKKLTSFSQLICTPPPRMSIDTFATALVPRLLEVIGELPSRQSTTGSQAQNDVYSLQSSPAQKNAACYALARLWEIAGKSVESTLNEHVYRFICPVNGTTSVDDEVGQIQRQEDRVVSTGDQLACAIELLAGLVDQSEPSSSFLTGLLAPIIIPLFAIHTYSTAHRPKITTMGEKTKAQKRQDVGTLAGTLFKTWLRLTDLSDVLTYLSPTSGRGLFGLQGKPLGALLVEEGKDQCGKEPFVVYGGTHLMVVWQESRPTQDTQMDTLGQLDISKLNIRITGVDDANEEPFVPAELLAAFEQNPSPEQLATSIKQSQRKDIAAALLIALLDAYTFAKQSRGQMHSANPLILVLYMQHIAQLINTFGSQLLQDQPAKVLSFISFALGQQPFSGHVDDGETFKGTEKNEDNDIPFIKPQAQSSSALSDLLDKNRNVSTVDAEMNFNDEDENNEEDDELKETALSLLLSLLESDSSITLETHSMLKVIKAAVQALCVHQNDAIRSLAKEAMLVLTARQSASAAAATSSDAQSTPRQIALQKGRAMYQEALKLLQDPILPVRAHGLVMLKELVAFGTTDTSKGVLMDVALTPAIMDIFVQAVCDDESFLYLNAVKGLSEMANTGGRGMLRRLMALYTGSDNIDNERRATMTQAEVDKRLRVGEAILQVVQKLEQALAPYTSDVVAPLLTAVRDGALSTTLRSSMLSILGTCIEACPKAMAVQGYAGSICEAMLDLLSVEMDSRGDGTMTQKQLDDAMNTDTKLPHLRRAALLLLSLLLRGASMQLQSVQEQRQKDAWQDDVPQLTTLRMPGGGRLGSLVVETKEDGVGDMWKRELLFAAERFGRTENVVGFVGQFDRDALTQHQAVEVLEDVEMYKLYAVQSGLL